MITPSKNQQQKRMEIIRVAANEFAEKGYDAANINEIARLSNIGKGTIYLYFKTKEELYLATIQLIVDQLNEMSNKIMLQELGSFEKIALFVHTFFGLDQENLAYLKLWSRHQFHNDPSFPEKISAIMANLRQPLCEIIEEGVKQGEFSTSHEKVIGNFVLSLLVMLMPSLQPAGMNTAVEPSEREPLVLDIARKILGKT